MHYTRRDLLKMSAAAIALSTSSYGAFRSYSPKKLAQDESFWSEVAAQFDIDHSFVNLENGYYGVMPAPVYNAYLRNTLRLNRFNSHLLRSAYKTELEAVRQQLASILGVSPEEIALTRGGTEALQNLISGYNKLEPGDEILHADLDYYSCQYAFKWLEDRRKIRLLKINIPEPAEKDAVIGAYSRAFAEHPRLKLVLLTHLNNRTGLVLPVAEIASIARQRGIDVIVDAAHSWGQLDFQIEDLKADFVGLSLHKWIHAPLGLGCLYIRKNKIRDIDPCFGDESFEQEDVRSRVHSGTLNVASALTLPAALDFHLNLGAQVKQERLRYLRNHWVEGVRHLDSVQILTPNDPQMYAGITSFRMRGRLSQAENEKIAQNLLEKHGIFTVRRGGVHQGDCIRVTPSIFTPIEHMERLAQALSFV